MQRNEADLQNKDKNPHQLPAEQNTRMAEHHRYWCVSHEHLVSREGVSQMGGAAKAALMRWRHSRS